MNRLQWGAATATAVIGLCWALGASAAAEVGRVVAVSPAERDDELAVQADGVQRVLRRGSMVFESDTLQTGPAGMLQVRFLDGNGPREGGVVSLKGNTVLEVATYRFDRPDEGPDRVLLKALQGSVRSVTGAVGRADPSSFEMTTPVASIGIRGTVFEVLERADGSWVFALWDGGIRVFNGAGSLDLGADAQFSFAEVAPQAAPRGLMTPPPQLVTPVAFSGGGSAADDADSGDDAATGDDGDAGATDGLTPQQADEQRVQRDGPTQPNDQYVDINPLTGLDEPAEVVALERELLSELFTLSPGERERLENGADTGLLLGLLPDGSVVTGRAVLDDEGAPLLAFTLPDGREALLRVGAGGLELDDDSGGITLGRVQPGPDGAAVQVDDGSELSATAVTSALTFALVENAELADLNVNAVYGGSSGLGSGSAGDITSLGVFFDAALDLGDGRITDGLLLVEVGDGAEEYRVSFGGQVSAGSAQLSVSEGIITGFAIDGTLDVDTDRSSIDGAFGPGGEAFGGGFQLQEADNAERNVEGAFAADKLSDTGAGSDATP